MNALSENALEQLILGCLHRLRTHPMSEDGIRNEMISLRSYREELRSIDAGNDLATPLAAPFFPPVACKSLPTPALEWIQSLGYSATSEGSSIDQCLEAKGWNLHLGSLE